MTRRLVRLAVLSILAAGAMPAWLQAQENGPAKTTSKWTPARTPDGHPDMQGMWVRRGAAMAEANAPKSPLAEFGATGQPYPTVFNNAAATAQDRSVLAGKPSGIIEPANKVLP